MSLNERARDAAGVSEHLGLCYCDNRVNEAVKENHSFSENVIKIGSKNVFRFFTLSFRKRKQKIRRIRERKEKRKEKEKNG